MLVFVHWFVSRSCLRAHAEKIERIYREVGGFGQLLVFGFDYVDNPKAWRHSLELLAKEVLPKVQHLKPTRAKLAAE